MIWFVSPPGATTCGLLYRDRDAMLCNPTVVLVPVLEPVTAEGVTCSGILGPGREMNVFAGRSVWYQHDL